MSLEDLIERIRREAADKCAAWSAADESTEAREALQTLSAWGATAWTVPMRDGGADNGGLSPADTVSVRALARLRDELAFQHGMLDVMLVMQGLGSFAVACGGSAGLREELLPDVAAGKRVAAFALTEEGAGSSLSEVATRAERRAEGWVLTGSKTFISNAGLADFYSVLARTSPTDAERPSFSMFYVPADSRGLRTKNFEVMAPHPIGEVHFDGVALPESSLLGEEGRGLDLALGTLARFRTSVAAAANGFARRALLESKRHLQSRSQFGKPLAANQGLRFDLAEMDTRLRAAQLLVEEAAACVDNGEAAVAEVARAKLFATETASWICDRAVQHLGGLGVKRGIIVERLYREVRALRIYEGTSEIQKLIIAKDFLARE